MRKSVFENAIPPPIVLLITIVLIWFISRFDTSLEITKEWRWGSAIIFVVIGLMLDVSSVLLFFRSKTTINPLKPGSTKQLVIKGFFNYSRNPMYLGMLFILVSVVCFFASPFSLVAIVVFFIFITRFQIIPEERAMLKLFNDEYIAYQQRVRRWL